MAKADRFYFENLTAAAECACKAADYLAACMKKYQPDMLKKMLNEVHTFEHSGDEKKHQMTAAWARAFVTPVEREDLALISQDIDDVTDCIEEVLQGLYMYNLKSITPEAVMFSAKIVECCKLMTEMLREFANFKKPERLSMLIVELNGVEEECDKLYVDATHLLPTRFDNALDIISWREIYNRMENCADACEHVGDCIDLIVMKNS